MIIREPFDVTGIVEVPLPLHLHKPGVVLPKTLEARPSNRCGVRSPIRGRELTEAVPAHADAAIDDGDQMSVGDEIEHVAAPGPVYAGKQ